MRRAPPLVLFDDLSHAIGGEDLQRLLTSDKIRGRILGKSEMSADIPVRSPFFATGNLMTNKKEDMTRRSLPVEIGDGTVDPQSRTQFHHNPIEAWVLAKRPRLLACMLRILTEWHAAGQPAPAGLVAMGSYEEWTRAVRHPVCWAFAELGLTDPAEAQRASFADNNDGVIQRGHDLVREWRQFDATGNGKTLNDAVAVASTPQRYPAIHAALVSAGWRANEDTHRALNQKFPLMFASPPHPPAAHRLRKQARHNGGYLYLAPIRDAEAAGAAGAAGAGGAGGGGGGGGAALVVRRRQPLTSAR
jgi:hypothetical protein